MTDADHMTLNSAAKLLGVSRSLMVRAVAAGLIRATTSPFKSNLNPEKSANLTLVNSEDVRSAARGDINLDALRDVKTVGPREVPKDSTETRECLANISQSVDQVAVMCSAILERLDAAPPTLKPKAPKGTKDYEPHN